MRIVRLATAPLRNAVTYARWIYLVLGGVLLVPFYLAVLVLFSLLAPGDVGEVQGGSVTVPVAGVLAAACAGATAWAPGVVPLQLQVTRSLLGGPLADEPALPPARRARAAAWTGLHFIVGFGVALATMIGLTEAATLALMPFAADPFGPDQGALVFPHELLAPGVLRWLGPVAGTALVVALVYGVALLGAGAARLAPFFFGPTAADRLAAAEERADSLAERNRLAAELHDSIGHALSVMALQAGAAARLLDNDPQFAREALTAIAEQARAAGADLDHVLGALREGRTSTSPQRTLADVEELVAAARAAGARIHLEQTGPVDAVPPTVSREAYRICQEGITNALRHGRRGAPISVRVTAGGGQLELRVTNPAPSALPVPRSHGGRGVRGMGERVRLLGGELDAGVRDGIWHLDVTVPWKAGP